MIDRIEFNKIEPTKIDIKLLANFKSLKFQNKSIFLNVLEKKFKNVKNFE